MKNFDGSISLSTSISGNPGDLVLATGSVDQTGTYVFEVEPQGVGTSRSKFASYWGVSNGNDTMFTLWNPTTAAQDILVTFYYGDGSGKYSLPVHLGPQASTMIDMAMLIAENKPDPDGHLIPSNIHEGSAQFASANGRNEMINLAIAGGIYNVSTATCISDCIWCCGGGNFSVSLSSNACGVGQTVTASNSAVDCNGYPLYPYWRSDNPTVASVDSNGNVSCLSPGQASITADWGNQVVTGASPGSVQFCGISSCPTSYEFSGETVTVKPPISGTAHDLWFFNGAQSSSGATVFPLRITLTTSGAGTWSVNAGSNQVSLSPQGATATVTSSGSNFSHAALDVSITVTVNGVTSDPFTLTTHRPYKLTLSGIDPSCDSGFGYSDLLHLKLVDQLNTDMSIYIFDSNETFTTAPVNDNGSNWALYGTPTPTPSTSSEVLDRITGVGINNQPPPSPTPVCSGNDTQVEHIVGHEWRIGGLAQGAGVRVSIEQWTRYADKANYLNFVSPSDPNF